MTEATQDHVLYEIADGKELKITPTTIGGIITQALTKEVEKKLEAPENTKKGKELLQELLAPALEIFIKEYGTQKRNIWKTKDALFTSKNLVPDEQDLLCVNNLVFLCCESWVYFLGTANPDLEKVKNEEKYNQYLDKMMRKVIHTRMTNQAIDGGRCLYYYEAKYFSKKTVTGRELNLIRSRDKYVHHILDKVETGSHNLTSLLKGCIDSPENVTRIEFGDKQKFKLNTVVPLYGLFLLKSGEAMTTRAKVGIVNKTLEFLKGIKDIHIPTISKKKATNANLLEGDLNKAFRRKVTLFDKQVLEDLVESSVFAYYSESDISSILTQVKYSYPLGFMELPSFKKLMQRARNNKELFNVPLLDYMRKFNAGSPDVDKEGAGKRACLFLVGLIYKQYLNTKSAEDFYGYLQDFIKLPQLVEQMKDKDTYASTLIPRFEKDTNFQDVLHTLNDANCVLGLADPSQEAPHPKIRSHVASFKIDFICYVLFHKILPEFQDLTPHLQEKMKQQKAYESIKNQIMTQFDFNQLQSAKWKYKEHLHKWFILFGLLNRDSLVELTKPLRDYVLGLNVSWLGEPYADLKEQVSEINQVLHIFLYCTNQETTKLPVLVKRYMLNLQGTFLAKDVTPEDMDGIYMKDKAPNSTIYKRLNEIEKYSSFGLLSKVIKMTKTEITAQDLADYKKLQTKRKRTVLENVEYRTIASKVTLSTIVNLNEILIRFHGFCTHNMRRVERETVFTQYFMIGKTSSNKKQKGLENLLSYITEPKGKTLPGFQSIEKTTAFLLHLESQTQIPNIQNYLNYYLLLTATRMQDTEPLKKSFVDAVNDVKWLIEYDRDTYLIMHWLLKRFPLQYNIESATSFIGDNKKTLIKSMKSTQTERKVGTTPDTHPDFIKQVYTALNYDPHTPPKKKEKQPTPEKKES